MPSFLVEEEGLDQFHVDAYRNCPMTKLLLLKCVLLLFGNADADWDDANGTDE